MNLYDMFTYIIEFMCHFNCKCQETKALYIDSKLGVTEKKTIDSELIKGDLF